LCAVSVTLNRREKLESNLNGNLMLWCWRLSYWCCKSFQCAAIWHHVGCCVHRAVLFVLWELSVCYNLTPCMLLCAHLSITLHGVVCKKTGVFKISWAWA
jgi:hypothetical protein